MENKDTLKRISYTTIDNISLREDGKSFRKIGKELGISEGVVRRRLKG